VYGIFCKSWNLRGKTGTFLMAAALAEAGKRNGEQVEIISNYSAR
jgi:hypothetical protein